MMTSKPSALLLLVLALVSCNPNETENQQRSGAIEAASVGSLVEPRPDDVRFYERPKLLAKLSSEGVALPEVVYIESNPWSSVMGSDSPSFALYDDGLVIYRDGDSFHSLRLNAEELRSLRASFSAVHDPKLAGGYDAASASDQPDNALLLYHDEPVFLSVYGSLDDEDVTSRLPASVRDAFLYVRSFHRDRSAEWSPEHLEVMIWPYEYAPGPSITWKSKWPSLSDPTTVRRGNGYSIYLPWNELDDFRAFLDTRLPKGAILIDGRKWSASFRIPFPAEELWMAPNPEVR